MGKSKRFLRKYCKNLRSSYVCSAAFALHLVLQKQPNSLAFKLTLQKTILITKRKGTFFTNQLPYRLLK